MHLVNPGNLNSGCVSFASQDSFTQTTGSYKYDHHNRLRQDTITLSGTAATRSVFRSSFFFWWPLWNPRIPGGVVHGLWHTGLKDLVGQRL